LIAFLDIEGPFNNVPPIAITKSITELGVEPPMVGLIHKANRDCNVGGRQI